MRAVYVLLVYLVVPSYCGVLLWRGLRERGYWKHFSERFGLGAAAVERGIWVHAASMGEVQAAATLVRRLLNLEPRLPLTLTTVTPAGRERAVALFGNEASIRYVPLDVPGAVSRFLDGVRPRVAIVFETEIWPNLYRASARRGVPLVIASARLSQRSVKGYRRFGSLFADALSRVDIAAQTREDADRFRSLGADSARIHVLGNVKFDLTIAPEVVERGRGLRERHAPARPVWVAGSTHPGEEQIVLEARRQVRDAHPDALLVLVPRHPNRFAEVADWLAREGVSFVRRSQDAACEPGTEVLLVDTLGELLDFYAMCDVAFVGGSLVPIGGHNLLEPAALGRPVLSGPQQFNSPDVARLLTERGALRIVRDSGELAREVSELLADGDERARIGARARACVDENRGALDRVLALVAAHIKR